MPRGRPPLDPEVKQQHREETLKRYSDKNADKLRKAARLRMQQHRADIANSDIFTQRRKRDEERAERHAADTVTRQARGIEKDTLHRKHPNHHCMLQRHLAPFHRSPPLPRRDAPPSSAYLPSPPHVTTRLILNPTTSASTLPRRRYGQRAPPAPSVVLTATRRTA
ncbi:hypothetical protein B0H14DRAFT_2570443 [Mycena olivaceomarginata]|nr:hypothetical protein B0H14DRAFT_2570443 [Mycena olivaceomarginata]